MKVLLLSHVRCFATPRTVAHQAPLSMEFFRQEYWTGLPFPSPGDLPNPGIEPRFPALWVDSLPLSHEGSPFNFSTNTLPSAKMVSKPPVFNYLFGSLFSMQASTHIKSKTLTLHTHIQYVHTHIHTDACTHRVTHTCIPHSHI